MKIKISYGKIITGYIVLLFSFVFISPAVSNTQSETNNLITLTLEDAIAMALEQNRNLIVVTNSIESSRLSLQAAHSVFDTKYAPSTRAGITDGDSDIGVGMSFSKKLTYGPVVSLTPDLRRTDNENTLRFSFGLTFPLLRGFGKDVNLSSVRSAEFNLRVSNRNEYLSKVNTVLTTISYAYRMDELKKLVDLYKSQRENLIAYANGSKVKKKVGLSTPMDEFRAEILLKDVEDQLFQSRNTLSDVEENFKKLLTLKPADRIKVVLADNLPSINISLDKAIDTALENRVEIKHARDVLTERIRELKIAEKKLLPDLDVTLKYDRYSNAEEMNQLMDLDEDSFSMHLTCSTDWARSTEKIAFRKNQIAVQNAKVEITLTKDTIIADVKQAHRANRKNLERIVIRKDQIYKAMQKLKLSTIKYQYEMADNFDVIESEREIQQAEADLLAVKTEYSVGVYRLEAAMGTLIDKE